MDITPASMRKAVTFWLREEGATIEQALMLQSAILAGVIAGSSYSGRRDGYDELIDEVDRELDRLWQSEAEEDEESWAIPIHCGCLIDTFERSRRARPSGLMRQASAETYALAMTINYGDTPATSKWAKAAEDGIVDYIKGLEYAVNN